MKVTYEQADGALEDLKKTLFRDFMQASKGGHPLINGAAPQRLSTAEWGVRVNLSRKPSAPEKKNLPEDHQGVKISYQVIGPVRKQRPS